MGNANGEWEGKHYFGWKSLSTLSKSVKRGICPYLEILNFFSQPISPELTYSYLKGSQCHKSQYLPKPSFTPLDSPFHRLGYPTVKREMSLCLEIIFFVKKPLLI